MQSRCPPRPGHQWKYHPPWCLVLMRSVRWMPLASIWMNFTLQFRQVRMHFCMGLCVCNVEKNSVSVYKKIHDASKSKCHFYCSSSFVQMYIYDYMMYQSNSTSDYLNILIAPDVILYNFCIIFIFCSPKKFWLPLDPIQGGYFSGWVLYAFASWNQKDFFFFLKSTVLLLNRKF